MKAPDNPQYVLFGGTFVLSNKLQFVGDKLVEGLSVKQWFLLRNISELHSESPPTITQLAREMDSTRQNIAKMLSTLERDGLVSLSQDQDDHRSRNVAITSEGSRRLGQMAQNAGGFFQSLYSGISPADLEKSAQVLRQMVSNLEAMQKEICQ